LNQKYLNETKYNWEEDPRGFRKDLDPQTEYIPSGRCYHCARLFKNSILGFRKKDPNSKEPDAFVEYKLRIAFCCECHKAMSVAKDGPMHDFDSFLNTYEKLAIREGQTPIEFDDEGKEENVVPNFTLANGEVLPAGIDEIEAERIKRLYDLDK